jgi:hypothetical protein
MSQEALFVVRRMDVTAAACGFARSASLASENYQEIKISPELSMEFKNIDAGHPGHRASTENHKSGCRSHEAKLAAIGSTAWTAHRYNLRMRGTFLYRCQSSPSR